MTLEVFKSSIAIADYPPSDLPKNLKALWYDAKGDWSKAHDVAQEIHTAEGSWIHAYLHRKEGDEWNAGYWYRKAGRPSPAGRSLSEEWEELASYFLAS